VRQVNEGNVIDGLQTRTRPSASTQLGERVRQLRVAAGLTQTNLAGTRFSKEYISQIERGKTRPTQETIEFLATQLGVDAGYVANGVETAELSRAEAQLAQAEALLAGARYQEAAQAFEGAQAGVAATGLAELELQRVCGLSWALMESGDVRRAVDMLVEVQTWSSFSSMNDLQRADYLYRLGVGRARLGSTHVAMGILSEAYKAGTEALASEALLAGILSWRSMCLQRLRDIDLAREDAEHAVALSERSGDPRTQAYALFQASLAADREGRYVLARRYAEQARAKYEEIDDQVQLGKILNNLGGVHFQMGDHDTALEHFKRAYSCLLDAGSDALCGAVLCSIAAVHLERGDFTIAEEQAQLSITLLEQDEEWAQECGENYYYLGRALLGQQRLDAAQEALERSVQLLESVRATNALARTILAQGDLARARDDEQGAGDLFRRAAELLQDVNF
jgi:tetratricopeptide (TPR) repeat protein